MLLLPVRAPSDQWPEEGLDEDTSPSATQLPEEAPSTAQPQSREEGLDEPPFREELLPIEPCRDELPLPREELRRCCCGSGLACLA